MIDDLRPLNGKTDQRGLLELQASTIGKIAFPFVNQSMPVSWVEASGAFVYAVLFKPEQRCAIGKPKSPAIDFNSLDSFCHIPYSSDGKGSPAAFFFLFSL